MPIWLNGPPPLSGFKNTTGSEVIVIPGHGLPGSLRLAPAHSERCQSTKIAQSPSSRCGITNRWAGLLLRRLRLLRKSPSTQALGITKYSIVTNSNDSVTLRLMTEHDLAMLYEWLNRSHIVEWWGGEEARPTLTYRNVLAKRFSARSILHTLQC